MRLLFHTLRSLTAADREAGASPSDPALTGSIIRRNGNRCNTINFVPRPRAVGGNALGHKACWSAAKAQRRLTGLRRAG
jgi:hypothetical protein